MTPEYESPWELFEQKKCTSPYDRVHFPCLHEHAEGRNECPVHSVRLKDKNQDWKMWTVYRNLYAYSIDQENADYMMKHMLEHVTETVPPLAPVRTRKQNAVDRWEPPSDLKIGIMMTVLGILAVVCFLAILL